MGSDQMIDYHQQMFLRPTTVLHPILNFSDNGHKRRVPMVQRPHEPEFWLKHLGELRAIWTSGKHRQPGMRLRCSAILGDLLYRFAYGDGTQVSAAAQEDLVWNSLTSTELSDRGVRIADLATKARMGETAYRATVKRLTGLAPGNGSSGDAVNRPSRCCKIARKAFKKLPCCAATMTPTILVGLFAGISANRQVIFANNPNLIRDAGFLAEGRQDGAVFGEDVAHRTHWHQARVAGVAHGECGQCARLGQWPYLSPAPAGRN